MTHESTASITRDRKRRNKKKKKVGEKERWRICFGLAHYYYYYYFDETIFISFRCNFCTWVHLACRLLLSCLLIFFFFLRKSWWFVLTKMEILFWFSLFISSLFFYLLDEIIFISFRCTFSRWIHLACGLLFSFLFFFS